MRKHPPFHPVTMTQGPIRVGPWCVNGGRQPEDTNRTALALRGGGVVTAGAPVAPSGALIRPNVGPTCQESACRRSPRPPWSHWATKQRSAGRARPHRNATTEPGRYHRTLGHTSDENGHHRDLGVWPLPGTGPAIAVLQDRRTESSRERSGRRFRGSGHLLEGSAFRGSGPPFEGFAFRGSGPPVEGSGFQGSGPPSEGSAFRGSGTPIRRVRFPRVRTPHPKGSVFEGPDPLSKGPVSKGPDPHPKGPLFEGPDPHSRGLVFEGPDPLSKGPVSKGPDPHPKGPIFEGPDPLLRARFS